jgi:molybdopterin/thiamine biosynthesis adenylyltransferase
MRMEADAQTVSLRIRTGRVLIVGVGGLGSPAALALAHVGVGTIGLIDPDVVDLSNLQRQILHHTPDLGRPKVRSAQEKLQRVRSSTHIFIHEDRLQVDNLPQLFDAYDFIIDATDGVATKFLINDGAVLLRKPFSYGGIVQFSGQTLTVLPGQTTCLRCLFPTIPSEGDIPTCQESGIIGSLAGSLGFIQAMEAVKYLSREGALLTDQLLTYDALASRWRAIAVRRNPRCPLCSETKAITSLQHLEYAPAESCALTR